MVQIFQKLHSNMQRMVSVLYVLLGINFVAHGFFQTNFLIDKKNWFSLWKYHKIKYSLKFPEEVNFAELSRCSAKVIDNKSLFAFRVWVWYAWILCTYLQFKDSHPFVWIFLLFPMFLKLIRELSRKCERKNPFRIQKNCVDK